MRKLLLHREEIDRLDRQDQGDRAARSCRCRCTSRTARAKVEIALARGKKAYDKRQALAERRGDARDRAGCLAPRPRRVQTDPVPNPRCRRSGQPAGRCVSPGCSRCPAYVLLAPGLAHAAGSDESTPLYDVSVTVARDGTTHINERITYDFANNPHHGIYRDHPSRLRLPAQTRLRPGPRGQQHQGLERRAARCQDRARRAKPHDPDRRSPQDRHRQATLHPQLRRQGRHNRFDGHARAGLERTGHGLGGAGHQGQRRGAVPDRRDERRLLPRTGRGLAALRRPPRSGPAWCTRPRRSSAPTRE